MSKYLCYTILLNRLSGIHALTYVLLISKAFDVIYRDTLWHFLRTYGIPTKLVDMIKVMYENCRCAVLDGTGQLEWFDVMSGVKQGCVVSGFSFFIVIDWIMIKTTEDNRNGFRWKFTTTLEDFDFADDIALLFSRLDHAQDKLSRLYQFT